MNINLTGATATEATGSNSKFKSVTPGKHTLTISKVEAAKAGSKDVLKVTFDSTEAEASFSHNFFVAGNTPETTKKILGRIQYLIEKFTGAPLEGDFSVEALSAVLVGKSKVSVVDGQIVPKNKDGKWYNNTFPTLRFAGFVLEDPSTYVHEEGNPNGYFMDRRNEMDLSAVNTEASSSTTSATVSDDLPF